MTTPQQDGLLRHLQGVGRPDSKGRVPALCPFHPDTNPSLRVWPKGSARCFGACNEHWRPLEFAKKLAEHLRIAPPPDPEGSVAVAYDYRDQTGRLVFQVVRRTGPAKKFVQRQPDPSSNDGWRWDLRGVERLPYRLPQLLAAPQNGTVYVVEGEKDADRLAVLGVVTTTNSGGAAKWKPSYSQYLRGHPVVILPDNDDAGEKHAHQIAASLHDIASEIRIVRLPGLGNHGDVSDWFNAGGTLEELQRLTTEVEPISGQDPRTASGQQGS